MITNNRGFTLLELLVAIAIMSIIGLLAWAVLFQGMTHSVNQKMKTTMQQELNLLLVALTRVHQTSDYYIISFNDNPNGNTITLYGFSEENGDITHQYSNNDFTYSLYIFNENSTEQDQWEEINTGINFYPSSQGQVNVPDAVNNGFIVFPNSADLPIRFILRDVNHSRSEIQLQTIISKIRG